MGSMFTRAAERERSEGAARRERAHEPLVSARVSGDAGHEDGCARDHVTPGVCVTGGEDAGEGACALRGGEAVCDGAI